jgi:pantothenate kinase type III
MLKMIVFMQEIKNNANSVLDSLYNEIRPAIEEHERDSQDCVATSVAEKWIEACCSKLKAEFDLHYSIVKNVACTPRRPHPEAKPLSPHRPHPEAKPSEGETTRVESGT